MCESNQKELNEMIDAAFLSDKKCERKQYLVVALLFHLIVDLNLFRSTWTKKIKFPYRIVLLATLISPSINDKIN